MQWRKLRRGDLKGSANSRLPPKKVKKDFCHSGEGVLDVNVHLKQM